MQATQEQQPSHSREYLRSLVLALYRVTAQLPPNDTLRIRLREEGLNIISHAEHIYAGDQDRYRHFVAAVQTLIHFCEIAQQEGLTDSRNFEALKHAFFQVRNAFEEGYAFPLEKLKKQVSIPRALPPLSWKKKEQHQPTPFIPRPKKRSPSTYITQRQRKLIDHLQEIKTAQASDFTSIFSNVSARTIRRDLDTLARSGQLVKEGKTNGTMYHLV